MCPHPRLEPGFQDSRRALITIWPISTLACLRLRFFKVAAQSWNVAYHGLTGATGPGLDRQYPLSILSSTTLDCHRTFAVPPFTWHETCTGGQYPPDGATLNSQTRPSQDILQEHRAATQLSVKVSSQFCTTLAPTVSWPCRWSRPSGERNDYQLSSAQKA